MRGDEIQVSGDERPAYWRETQHSMLRRCSNWDYSQPAIYMITVVLADRRSQALGRVIADNEAAPSTAHCELTELGKAVAACWEAIPKFYPQIKIIAKQVMPDHFHGILWVKSPLKCHLGQVIKGFKIGCNRAMGERRPAMVSRVTGLGLRPAMVSQVTGLGLGLFAAGFQDRILFREGQLAAMINYLKANPLRLAQKRANPQLFIVYREVLVSLGAEGKGRFAAIGNLGLLELPMVQVQCSRRYFAYRRIPKPGSGMKIAKDIAGEPIIERCSPEYESRLNAVLTAASHGAVVLSPCISDGEKQIAREALKRNMRLVALKNMGFAKCEKPYGRLFEACVDGRLLMLAPAAWPYSTQAKAMTRFDATALNRIAQWLAGEYAVEINYHGMQPSNIDRLAEEAVMARK
jgi:hypothetical protein